MYFLLVLVLFPSLGYARVRDKLMAGPVARPATPGVCYRRRRTVALDGCSSVKAPDQPRVAIPAH